ncbi:hypothetical protein [Rahnella inusitata]|uniref:hypothetical protein n=1 Tax=Rahnella inusitata TaxID=58169 RepID=UPI0039B0DC94
MGHSRILKQFCAYFGFLLSVISWPFAPKPSRGEKLFPSALPTLFHTRAMHTCYVSATTVIAAKSRRCAVPFARVTTRAKKARFSTSPSGVIFERGQSFLGHNFTHSDQFKNQIRFANFLFLSLKNAEMARSKNPAERSGLKTLGFRTE